MSKADTPGLAVGSGATANNSRKRPMSSSRPASNGGPAPAAQSSRNFSAVRTIGLTTDSSESRIRYCFGRGTYTDATFSGPNSTSAVPRGRFVCFNGVSTVAV